MRGKKAHIAPNSKTFHSTDSRKKAPQKLHHPPARSTNDSSETGKGQALPVELELINVIKSSLRDTLSKPDLNDQIQKIKGLLYDKRFLEVFEDEALLGAYGARWVPSRSLAFRELMEELDPVKKAMGLIGRSSKGKGKQIAGSDEEDEERAPRARVVCIGGGAGSELIAIAAMIRDAQTSGRSSNGLICNVLDIGPFDALINSFEAGIQKSLSLDSASLDIHFTRCDVLATPSSLEPSTLTSLLQQPASSTLITLLFTLTELFVQSRTQTILFLRHLTDATPLGSLFLVIDSANEGANALEVGAEGRKWNLASVLDGLLTRPPVGAGEDEQKWKCLDKRDSRWYRMREGLQEEYPVKLENTRYWMRVYKRV